MNPTTACHRKLVTRRPRQRGMVTVVVMLFLIATVIFALSQMLNVSSGNVIDGQRQGNSTAAFYLAESGLERAQASLSDAYGTSINNTSCTGVAATYNLGLGTVALTGVSTPPTCDNDGGTPCTACTVTATGQVGISTRTLTRDLALTITNGTTCNGAYTSCGNNPVTWRLRLKNAEAVAGIGIFNLTYIKHGNNAATCAAGSNCELQLALSSPSSGVNSTGLQGNAVLIPAGGTYPIYQIMNKSDKNLAEVGTFFRGTTAPALTGPTANPGAASYWDDDKNGVAKTVGQSGSSTGGTNDGTATSGGTCRAPNLAAQNCTSWCHGGDTLVFSFAGNVTALTDELSSVTFGTNASVGQNFPMTRIAKYPTALVGGAPKNVDAEIWYARNPNFTPASTPLAVNASSYKGRGNGAIGASWTSNNSDTTAVSGTTLTVGNSFTDYPNQLISAGDTVFWSAGGGTPACPSGTSCGTVGAQVTPLLAGEQTGGRGRYTLTGALAVGSANNRVWTIKSNFLRVSACTICFFANGDALSGLVSGRSINNIQSSLNNGFGLTETAGGIGRYPIDGTATFVASGATLRAGTPNATLYLPSGSSQPTVTTPAMRVIVKSGTGVVAPNTTVTAVNSAPTGATSTTAFTVSTAPTTALDGASLCAGTCALFVPSTTTTFALGGITANFNEWASGFTCLKGVDLMPQVVTTTSPANARWIEVVN